ncbi:nuclear transport factor 2 family protein [Paenibacillus guangzhouensis]|uniref:nuclear transport factor 2 family protein n=1 Tax=Paenibacillus guangzhouensis TaxID=1473112 RepID=UPI0012671731|nr:nuclear transport factor 2 family protein [Paenibacillus guangzhouensis]
MTSKGNREMINHYIEAYNAFDVAGMVRLLHQDVIFRNYANGELNTETKGVEAFKALAEQSTQIFSSRRQTIVDYHDARNQIEVQIDYEGTIAEDLPNGLKTGDQLQMAGKSVFRFTDGLISLIEDYS